MYSATIEGYVTDSRTREPLIGANVFIQSKQIGAATNTTGYYIINDVPPGKFILRAGYIAYSDCVDSVDIKDSCEVIELNLVLKSPIVELDLVSTPQIEAYHTRLQKQNGTSPVMLIHIDSLKYSEHFLWAYLSVTNNSDDSFYIFKDYVCFNVLRPLVRDSTGKEIKISRFVIDCVGEKTCPDSTDLVYVGAGKTVKYPPTKLTFCNFDHKPKGKYFIKVKYEFDKPETINTFYCRGEESIRILVTGLRGTYISSNEVTFVNK
jgi:CarboxypepD_reg-like domain